MSTADLDLPPELRVDADAALEDMARWLRERFAAAGLRRAVLGLSGGLDSATTAMVAARALGEENLVLVALPYGTVRGGRQAPSTRDSLEDAERVVRLLPGADWRVHDISAATDAAADALGLHERLAADPANARLVLTFGNLKARQRAVHLYAVANELGDAMVTGTENRTENLLGYFTLHGDAASDVEVLSPWLKTEVRQIARAAGVPPEILAKRPSADLWPGQTDEGELGFTYRDADRVLASLFPRGDEPVPEEPPAVRGVEPAVVRAVLRRMRATAWKRAAKPTYARPAAGTRTTT